METSSMGFFESMRLNLLRRDLGGEGGQEH